jgi:cytosine/adenosine deaminase-related metal-dependent hydrolase
MTSPSTLLVRGGTVITCHPGTNAAGDVLLDHDVLIRDGRIAEIGTGLDAGDAEVIDAGDFIVMPGLIDGHRHVTDVIYSQISSDLTLGAYFAALPGPHGGIADEDLFISSRGGARMALEAGVTTILDWSLSAQTRDGGHAALTGYQEAGARVLFAFGPGAGVIGEDPDAEDTRAHDDTADLLKTWGNNPGALIQLWVAGRGPEFTAFDIAKGEIDMARSLGLRTSIHMGGLTVGMQGKVLDLEKADLLGNDLHFAHCCLLSPDEMRAMAEHGVGASVSPYVEATLGIGPCAYLQLRDAGVKTGLSTDSVALTGQGLFQEARSLLALERSRVHSATLLEERQDPSDSTFLTAHDALVAMTYDSAKAVGLEDEIGSLAPGKAADIILVDKRRLGVHPLNAASALVISAETSAIDTVIVGGVVRKRAGALVDAPVDEVLAELAQSRTRVPANMPEVRWVP